MICICHPRFPRPLLHQRGRGCKEVLWNGRMKLFSAPDMRPPPDPDRRSAIADTMRSSINPLASSKDALESAPMAFSLLDYGFDTGIWSDGRQHQSWQRSRALFPSWPSVISSAQPHSNILRPETTGDFNPKALDAASLLRPRLRVALSQWC